MAYIYEYMPQYRTGTSLGLTKLKVDAEDTSFLSSAYFLLSEFDNNFRLGKNSITLNNPPADLKVEAYDSANNILYFEKATNNDFINKTKSVTLSFHVYPQNSNGIGKIILVGTYNNKIIRYVTIVNIDTTTINNSKIRFYNPPTIEVAPLLVFATKTNISELNPKTLTGSFYTKAVLPSSNFTLDNKYNKDATDYQVVSNLPNFSSSLESFYINLNVNKIKNLNDAGEIVVNQTSSILVKNVVNSTTLQLDTPYVYNNSANNKLTVAEITNGNFNINYSSYNYNSSYFTTQSYLTESIGLNGSARYKKYSIAEITYRNLDTFSGTVVRHKVYKKSLNIQSDYTVIMDENFLNNEILINYTVPVKTYKNLGSFYSQNFIDTFWFTSSAAFNLTYDSSSLIDAMNINGSSTITDGYVLVKLNTDPTSNRNVNYIPYNSTQYADQSGSAYDTNFLKLNQATDYILSFNCNLISKNISDIATLDFYLTGSYINNNKEKDYSAQYGVHLASLKIPDQVTSKNYHNNLKFKFTPTNDLYGTLVIVPRNLKSVIINKLSIVYDRTKGFSPSSYTVRVPFDVDQPKELFDIKAELYDNNSNLVYSNLRTVQLFDPSGSTVVYPLNTDVITAGTVNVTNALNVTGSINVNNFSCTPADNLNQVDYLVTWDRNNKNLCVLTSSGISTGGGLTPGATYPITSSWANNVISSSYALTASYIAGVSNVSSSYALTSSFATSASAAINSQTASFLPVATYLITSSWSNNSLTASYVTASKIFGTVTSASYALSSSYAPTNTNITASWATNSLTASYITSSNIVGTVTSASYARTASYYNGSVISSSYALSSSYASTASYSANSLSSSYCINPFPISGSLGYWGSFWDSTTQNNDSASNAMRLGSSDPLSNGIRIVSGSKIHFDHDGVYNVQFSAVFNKSNANSDDINVWVVKNGNNLSDTNTVFSVAGQSTSVAAWNFVLSLVTGDELQLYWHANASTISILNYATQSVPSIPATPSLIVTATQVTNTQIAASASYATSASYAPTNTNITSSWSTNSLTASSINFTASNSILAQTASYVTASNVVGTVTSASYALSSSYAPTNTNITASWAQSASYAINSQTSSYLPVGSYNITASWSNNSLTSSYVTASSIVGTVTSASYALSTSYAPTNITSSWSNNSISSSYATTASYAPTNANLTASYAIFASVSSSLNFTDDVGAAAGGVPLGGLYRNGNFILIRLS